MSDSKYFASKSPQETSAVLLGKSEYWYNILESNGYMEKLRQMWLAYHGAYYMGVGSGHQITFSGEQGELANLPINHLRNLAQHILVITTSNRPVMEARATNTDYKSLTQTYLANGLLDYYMREKRLERYIKKAVEHAIVLSAGFIKMEWDALGGEIYDYNEDTNTPVYEGDVKFTNLSAFDVVFDGTKENPEEQDWVLCRSFKNRFDLMAKYPELADKIRGVPSKSDLESRGLKLRTLGIYDTDDIAIYEFYHKRTESMPDGRYMLFLTPEIVLLDSPMPYRSLPIFRIAASDILGTPYGYTPVFDLLPMQEAINSLYSTVLSNQAAFGVQNIAVPRGADIDVNNLAGGLNVIEYNQGAGKPEALNLTQTPAEIFKMIDILRQEMETISGVNSVARGNPEASLKSGAALALVQSMALQFLSGLQQAYVQLIEDLGTALINMLKDFAAVPRVAAIVGKSNKTFMKEFKGDDLTNVNRVIVDVGNPLARTTAGRVQMAEQMLQMGLIKDPQQYFTVMNVGKLDVINEGPQAELLLIKGENEKMVSGEKVIALAVDDHKNHILEHKSVLADPDLRQDPSLVQLVLDHVQQHIELLRDTDPDLLGLLGQQPLQPQQGQAPGPQGPPPPQGGGGASGPMVPPEQGQTGIQNNGETVTGPGIEAGVNMPNIPKPPAPFDNLPTNPSEMPPK